MIIFLISFPCSVFINKRHNYFKYQLSYHFLGSYIHSASPESSSSSSSSSQKSSHLPGTGFMAGVIIGAIAGAFVLSALVSQKAKYFCYKQITKHKYILNITLESICFKTPNYRSLWHCIDDFGTNRYTTSILIILCIVPQNVQKKM